MFYKIDSKYLNSKLEYGEIILLAIINSLTTTQKGCFASNKYLAEKLHCSERTIRRYLKNLQLNNYLKINFEEQNKRTIVVIDDHGGGHECP